MKFTNFKYLANAFPIENAAHVRSRKTFYHISVNFRNPGFHLVFNYIQNRSDHYLEVCNVKPTYRKSWAGDLLMWSDLTLGPSFEIKRG